MDENKLAKILKKHVAWVNNEPDGERANLFGANLSGSNLSGVNLQGADLRRVNLQGADLHGADLYMADMFGANLYEADLRKTNLYGANLNRANLNRADLEGTKIEEKMKIKLFPLVCPEEGSFIAWKTNGIFIIKLRVLEDAKRSSAYGRKCRCSKAEVLEIQDMDGTKVDVTSVHSNYNYDFVYTVGETVEVYNFDENRWNECSSGIHFFITRQEAVDYLI